MVLSSSNNIWGLLLELDLYMYLKPVIAVEGLGLEWSLHISVKLVIRLQSVLRVTHQDPHATGVL